MNGGDTKQEQNTTTETTYENIQGVESGANVVSGNSGPVSIQMADTNALKVSGQAIQVVKDITANVLQGVADTYTLQSKENRDFATQVIERSKPGAGEVDKMMAIAVAGAVAIAVAASMKRG